MKAQILATLLLAATVGGCASGASQSGPWATGFGASQIVLKSQPA
jgi:hypothetical protein